MSSGTFALESLYRNNLPAPAQPWKGLARLTFNGGHNDPLKVPSKALADAAASVLARMGDKLAIYNLGQGPQGYEDLRAFISDKLAASRGITCSKGDLLVTSGSGQGLELVNAVFLERGDTVLVEEFTFQSALTRYRKLGINAVPVPMDQHGLRMDALVRILDDLKTRSVTPKFLYTIPTIQNPTGTILSLDRRVELLSIARTYGTAIFEDECYADLLWGGENPPALYGMDSTHVIHIGSFSKTLAPAIRLGYLVAPWNLMSRILPMKTDAGTGALDQMITAEYFSKYYDDHIRSITLSLREKMEIMVDALHREFGASAEFTAPDGGMFIWIRLPDQVDSRTLVAPAAAADIAFNPGTDWCWNPEDGKSYIRLCFALPTADEIRFGVAELARLCFERYGVPERSANAVRSSAAFRG